MFRNPLEETLFTKKPHYVVYKKNSLCALRAHNVRTHYARTLVAHCVHQRAACPS